MKNLTIAQLEEAFKRSQYLLLRLRNNQVHAVNSRVLRCEKLQKDKVERGVKSETSFYSYRTCTFHEYISRKTPFMKDSKDI